MDFIPFKKIAKYRFLICSFSFVFFHFNTLAQQIDTTKYHQIEFIKFNQANDLYTVWFQSDKYFTNGINIELALPEFNTSIADKVLWGFKSPFKDFTISLNQDIYTPENISMVNVDSTDRPYAGQLYFVYSKYSNNFWKGRKLSSQLYFGFQGPMAMAAEMQNAVHSLIDNKNAQGWDNQINNGLIADYKIEYHHLIPISSSFTEIHGFTNLRTGTLNTSTELGIRFKIGRYTDSYLNLYGLSNRKHKHIFSEADLDKMSHLRKKMIPKRVRKQGAKAQLNYLNQKINRKFQLYFFVEGSVEYVLRDGSVEGSLIQFKPSVYTYDHDDYDHSVRGSKYGFVSQYRGLYIEYSRYLFTDYYVEDNLFGYGTVVVSWIF